MKQELQSRRVLIIDDEPDLRNALARIMKRLNLECEVASNGLEALQLLRAGEFHAVLCDIMMPEMNGLECLAVAQTEGIRAPFIFLTGYGDARTMLQAIRLGALDFISKPFDFDEVSEVIFRILEIGWRKAQIYDAIEKMDPTLMERIKKEEKVISLMRASNNMKRTA